MRHKKLSFLALAAASAIALSGCAGGGAGETEVTPEAAPEAFFSNPQSPRAKDFLSKILAH